MTKFIDREKELEIFESRYQSKRAEFLILYGRRRVGKTELLLKFLKKHKGIYLLGILQSEKDQLERFSKIIASYFQDEFLAKNPFASWEAFFTYLSGKTSRERIVVIIDEVPFLVKSAPSFLSFLQGFWDQKFKRTRIFLILCGSLISMMEKETLGYKSPIYGRRTGQVLLEPLGFFEAQKFFPKFSLEEKIQAFAILGGTPAYLEQFEDNLSLFENLEKHLLPKDSFLYKDAQFILREELSEPQFYFSILKALGAAKTKLGHIINATGLAKGLVAKYLATLKDLYLVERRVPITEEKPQKSRKGLYFLKDNFFKFYFRFVYPNLDLFEREEKKEIFKIIRQGLDQFTSLIFEEISLQFLERLNKKGKLPRFYSRFGKFWDGKTEVDILALNEKTREILFSEVKWQKQLVDQDVFFALKEKAKAILWKQEKRREHFAIISKKGFTKRLWELAKKENLLLFSLTDFSMSTPEVA